ALTEVRPLGPALHGARMAQLGAEHAPEPAHAQLVAGIAEAGTEEEAGEVQPARLVRGRARARRLERPERVPEPADRRHRPGVAPGPERRLEPARERDRIVTAREGGGGVGGGEDAGRARRDELARAVAAAVGRREQREGDGPVGGQLELGLRDLALLALLHAARHEAERAPVAEPEVVGARRAAADA